LATNPGDVEASLQRGNLFLRLGRPHAALRDYDRALDLHPNLLAAHMACGHALYQIGRYHEAVDAYQRVIDREKDNVLALFNCGNALQKLRQFSDAIDSYQKALAIKPDLAEALLEIAHCRLTRSEFAAGWPLYEWRWRTAQMQPFQLFSAQPRWLGESGLAQKTILLWAEQGLGDSIQFARFVPRVAEQAGRVILRVPETLLQLMSGLDPRVSVICEEEPLPSHDCHCPLMSLPLALGITDDFRPATQPYLQAEAALRDDWRDRLGRERGPRIGLVWAGRRHGRTGAYKPSRDIAFEALRPLASLGIRFICLQRDMTAAEVASLSEFPAFRPIEPQPGDFADAAALLANLDGVISVDTAMAHLAGALGVPCWLLLQHASEWRWQRGRTDSPWYSSIRFLQQKTEGDWNEVVQRLIVALVREYRLEEVAGVAAGR
jgi:tetratricopeptide (TPR) repeat protein